MCWSSRWSCTSPRTLAALRIPPTQVAASPATAEESAELHGAGIRLAASAMGLVRGIVGFLTFLVLFDLRDQPTLQIGAVLLMSGAGALLGSALAPAIRRTLPEERMLMLALSVCVAGALTASWVGGLAGSMLLAGIVAIVSTSGRLAFDSLVQRDAPDANRGRSFASFELRFQLVWVVGAVIPVLVRIPLTVGFVAIAGVAGFALFSYAAGQRATNREPPSPRPTIPPRSSTPPRSTTPCPWETLTLGGAGGGSAPRSPLAREAIRLRRSLTSSRARRRRTDQLGGARRRRATTTARG